MPKGQSSRKEAVRVRMEDGLSTEQRLQQWGAAAELLYAPHSPVHQPPSHKEPHAFLVARRIATVMARLNELCQKEAEVLMTPREALLELADIIRFGLVSFHKEVVLGQLDQREIAAVLAEYIAHRTAPQAGVVEGLHVIAWISVKLRVEMFLQQLRMRLKVELENSHSGGIRSEEQVVALNTTIILANDFETSYDNLLVTFPCVQLMDSAPEAAEQLMPVLSKQYYQLAQWVELVENTTLQSPNTSKDENSSTKVQSIDRESSTVVIRRTDLTSPWGLIFNECGRLVDVDISLRSASAEGEELHRLLRCTTEGASVIAINSTTVPNILPDGAEEVLEIIKNTTSEYKRITMKLESNTFKQLHIQQLAFFLPNQGGEGSSGQRAILVLHRPDRNMPWGFNFSEDLVVQHIPAHNMSINAKTFFSEYQGTVVLLAVNGVEVTTPIQADALCIHSETIVLNLVVLTPAMIGLRRRPTHGKETVLIQQQQQKYPTREIITETPLVGETTLTRSPNQKKKTRKSPRKKTEVHAEDVDAAMDVAYTAEANEAEELSVEPPKTAEEEDVKETYPAVADEDTAEEQEQKQIELQQQLKEEQEKEKQREQQLLQEQKEREEHQLKEEQEKQREQQLLQEQKEREEQQLKEEQEKQREQQLLQEQKKKQQQEKQQQEKQLIQEQEKKKPQQQQQLKEEEEEERDHPVAEVTDSNSTPEPLVMPNDTTIELLTPNEMIIRRESTDKKWGLTLESIGGGLDRSVRMTGLPLLASKHDIRRRHPFYKTFQKPPVKTDWRIQSVNGTPASKAQELLDIMRRSLIMRIKFFKGR
ncbi:uncharacterized protein TM35_000084130 [Trypanosoma theileri]|uniref:Uncharacterized protein n=1 Tax=Trypanosoma theileri TaxID=67003 RepID=A0A1X0P140_9TRYP|nr:uncharacterized protein TM35_000084130 [Trypanosoma theileri]ORC90615.1 hypothetical protein TM35_000084130 [Trypanosoma theileri]